jgi:predicted DNA-binding transcriptional regulator YafY
VTFLVTSYRKKLKGIMMRGKNLIKLLKALEILSKPEGTTIEQMATQLEIDRRSVYRLIEVIEDLGFPIYDEKIPFEKEKRWKLEESYLKKLPNMKVPDINLTLPEIISLYLLRSEASLLKGTELEKHTNSAFGKFSMFLPKDAFGKLDKIKALFVSAFKFVKDYSGKEDLIGQLMDAIMKKETCYIGYHSFYDDKIKSFKIDPLHFFENDGGLYILVNTTTFGDIRTLAVERIQSIKKTGVSFVYPEDFDPEALLESAFDIVYGNPVKVKIWFSAEQARYIKERKWSRNQEIVDQEDGSIILSMETSGWWDVKRWVLSYGSEAMVLEPDMLRKEVMAELAATQNLYV